MNRSFYILSVIVTMSTVLLATIGLLTSCGGVDSGFLPLPSDFLLSSPSDSSVVSGTTPTLVWTDATGEDQYYVQISDAPTFGSNFEYTMPVSSNTTSFTVPTSILTASTRYYWRVRAINGSGPTTASNAPFSFTTTVAP